MLRRAVSWLRNRTLRGAWAAWIALREERLEQLAAGKAKNMAAARYSVAGFLTSSSMCGCQNRLAAPRPCLPGACSTGREGHGTKLCLPHIMCMVLCRSFAHWRQYVRLVLAKRAALRKAALKCFATYSTRVWVGWRHLTTLAVKLRGALAARKV